MDLGIKNALVVYFHGEFFRTAPAACSFIPLRPKARDPVAHTEPPGHLLPRVGLGKCWPVRRNSRFPRFFSRFGQKFPGLVTTGILSQTIDKTIRILKESAASDAESNVFPVNWPAAVTEAEGSTRGRRGSARSPRLWPKGPNRRAHRGAWWLRSRIRQRRACR
jgi:hypothetical protein